MLMVGWWLSSPTSQQLSRHAGADHRWWLHCAKLADAAYIGMYIYIYIDIYWNIQAEAGNELATNVFKQKM